MNVRFMNLIFVVLGLLTACGDDFEPGYRVTDFRLLAVAADLPLAFPGETVKLTTLFHEPFGRPITWAWTTCPLPADTTLFGCLGRISELTSRGQAPPIVQGVGLSTFEVPIPADILDGVPAVARANATVGVLTAACPGELSTRPPETVGRGELPFRCVDAITREELTYDRFVVSVKRINLRTTERNALPVVSSVLFDGQPWNEGEVREVNACDFDTNTFDDCKGEKHRIASVTPPNTAESGTTEAGAPFTESVVLWYYATEGAFEFALKTTDEPETQWAARSTSRGRTLDLWFVIRDDRGGVSWTTRQVRVR